MGSFLWYCSRKALSMKTNHSLDERISPYVTCIGVFGTIELFNDNSFSIEEFLFNNHGLCVLDAGICDSLFPLEYLYEGIVKLVLVRAQTTMAYPEAIVLFKECGYCFVGFTGLAHLVTMYSRSRRMLPATILAPHCTTYHAHDMRYAQHIQGLPLLENKAKKKMLLGCSRKSTLTVLQRHTYLLFGYHY